MMQHDLFRWLQNLSVSTAVRESTWIFPALECVHIYSMVLLVSVFAIFDLRLLGFSLGGEATESLSRLSHRSLRWGWLCFGINAVTGSLLFSSEAVKMSGNWAFQLKMVLILFALVVHTIVLRKSVKWEGIVPLPLQAKLMGSVSLLLWVGVIAASRWIAFITKALLLE
jgi:uncharacterized protein DUF6644